MEGYKIKVISVCGFILDFDSPRMRFILNGEDLTQEDIDMFNAIHGENAQSFIDNEIFIRQLHKKIIDLNDIQGFAEYIKNDPNDGFMDYCVINDLL